jgi:branched-chain amino acid transport system substrate-binding protein
MKKALMAIAASTLLATPALAMDVKIGIIFGFTGPIESLAPDMAAGAELAIDEVNDSGQFMDNTQVTSVRGDSTCVDSAAATAAAERLVTADKVAGIVGADCSGVTTSILQNVAMANGIVMVSPSATLPALSTLEDNGLFFRTAPSDARQGQIIAEILIDRGIKTAAISYINTDYGKGLADSIAESYAKVGGSITIATSHETGKADYGAEVATLAQAGGDILIVASYLDQGGNGIIQASLDSGAFDLFFMPDGMVGDSLPAAIGPDLNGSIGSAPGTDSSGAETFSVMVEKAGFTNGPYAAESYDAAALILLAMQASGSTDSTVYKNKITDIANAPGMKIYPGELGKALKAIAAGKDVDYVGATSVELIGGGESAGNYKEIIIKDGKNTTARYR